MYREIILIFQMGVCICMLLDRFLLFFLSTVYYGNLKKKKLKLSGRIVAQKIKYLSKLMYLLVVSLVRIRIVPVHFIMNYVFAGVCRTRPLQRNGRFANVSSPKTTRLRWDTFNYKILKLKLNIFNAMMRLNKLKHIYIR